MPIEPIFKEQCLAERNLGRRLRIVRRYHPRIEIVREPRLLVGFWFGEWAGSVSMRGAK
jgi:hypothetical protein